MVMPPRLFSFARGPLIAGLHAGFPRKNLATQALHGQVALVTGAGRAAGAGRAIALRLAAAGADVAVADIGRPSTELDVPGVGLGDGESELEATVRMIRDLGRRGVAVAIDITDQASVCRGVEEAAKDLGHPTVLVNNAGAGVGAKTFDHVTTEEWELSFRVNVVGAIKMIHAVLPAMRRKRSGSIVNIVSTLGLAAMPGSGAYTVSKHAAVGLTRLLSQELAPAGIRVNAVATGKIDTERGRAEEVKTAWANSAAQKTVSDVVADIPVRRLGLPADVAEAVAWLADPKASFVNGAVIPVHGGQIPGFS